MTTLTKFTDCATDPVEKDTTDVAVAGTPKHIAWPHFIGDGGQVRSGVWESTAGSFRGPMKDQIEFCHILEGEAEIETGVGERITVRVGDGFVMDNGLEPVWHVADYVKKHFVIIAIDPVGI
ncbi:DUF861 domain-containing protein [Pelagibius litoralis]|uniref:DUF861 domain-containing protein n=1 Tax=Pelagibius litoralis TaxID=374515 RepID=A0A967KFG4_9PROT|nr:cupin domain-containing protein [Pelagibius litoralis]NIA71310.1 DUF861 domain-containing protein [Pelagibius litoralis]